jgi:hypothetical protein
LAEYNIYLRLWGVSGRKHYRENNWGLVYLPFFPVSEKEYKALILFGRSLFCSKSGEAGGEVAPKKFWKQQLGSCTS